MLHLPQQLLLQLKQNSSMATDKHETWKLVSHKISTKRIKPISIADSIWYSENNAMVQYNYKSNSVMTRVPFPKYMTNPSPYPQWYACCKYINNIYIIDDIHHQIILFIPSNHKFIIKTKIPKSCCQCLCAYVIINDEIHMIADYNSTDYGIYSLTNDTLKIIKDATNDIDFYGVSLIKYKKKLIKFGGISFNTGEPVDEFYITDDIVHSDDEGRDIKYRLIKECDFPISWESDYGYMIYKDLLFIFGGMVYDEAYLMGDGIYCLDLLSGNYRWREMKMKCPERNGYDVIFVDKTEEDDLLITGYVNKECVGCKLNVLSLDLIDMIKGFYPTMSEIHLFTNGPHEDCKHYSISVSTMINQGFRG